MGQKRGSRAREYRAFTRQSFEVPVEYVVQGKSTPLTATMHNLGAGGMYLETRKSLTPGMELSIRVLDYSPDIHGEHESYRGRVVWSGQVDRGTERLYGVGVRFLPKAPTHRHPRQSAARLQH